MHLLALALALLAVAPPPARVAPPPPAHGGPAPAARQEPAPDGTAEPSDAERGRALWTRLVAAASPAEPRPPATAFRLAARIRHRDGVQRNDVEAAYAFLAPDLVRFRLESGKETGRGPGRGLDAYWLSDGERVVRLSAREHAEDRATVRRMAGLARNYLALSDLARLDVRELAAVERPHGLPRALRWRLGRHAWLGLTSPAFDLLDDAPAAPDGAERLHRVELALDPGTWLPAAAVVRAVVPEETPAPPPLLLVLEGWREVDGWRVPHRVHVHRAEPDGFEEEASQEIDVRAVDLDPALTQADFLPPSR